MRTEKGSSTKYIVPGIILLIGEITVGLGFALAAKYLPIPGIGLAIVAMSVLLIYIFRLIDKFAKQVEQANASRQARIKELEAQVAEQNTTIHELQLSAAEEIAPELVLALRSNDLELVATHFIRLDKGLHKVVYNACLRFWKERNVEDETYPFFLFVDGDVTNLIDKMLRQPSRKFIRPLVTALTGEDVLVQMMDMDIMGLLDKARVYRSNLHAQTVAVNRLQQLFDAIDYRAYRTSESWAQSLIKMCSDNDQQALAKLYVEAYAKSSTVAAKIAEMLQRPYTGLVDVMQSSNFTPLLEVAAGEGDNAAAASWCIALLADVKAEEIRDLITLSTKREEVLMRHAVALNNGKKPRTVQLFTQLVALRQTTAQA